MIVKPWRPDNTRLLELQILRERFDLPEDKRWLVEDEWRRLQRGIKGEKDTAYYLDFDFAESQNVAVLHDLRIRHGERTAQIDHILINRLLDCYVLETKLLTGKIEIRPDGSFVAHYKNRSIGIPSPWEQARRHIQILKLMIESRDLSPKRMGLPLPIRYIPVVVLHPRCYLVADRRWQKEFNIVKADQFRSWYDKRYENRSNTSVVLDTFKLISSETLRAFAEQIAALHENAQVNYMEIFGLSKSDLRPKGQVSAKEKGQEKRGQSAKKERKNQKGNPYQGSSKYYCAGCGKSISARVAAYCFERKGRFGGRAYCMDCQKRF